MRKLLVILTLIMLIACTDGMRLDQLKNGTMTQDIPMGGYKVTGAANGTALHDVAPMSQIFPVVGTACVYGNASYTWGIAANGTKVYSGVNASECLNEVMSNLTADRDYRETVRTYGTLTFPGRITIPNYTSIENRGKWIISNNVTEAEGVIGPEYPGSIMGDNPSNTVGSNVDISIIGGTIDCNDATATLMSFASLDGLVLKDITFTNPTSGHHGIITLWSRNVLIEGCNFTNLYILNAFGWDQLIRHNRFVGTHESPVSAGSANLLARNITIESNYMDCRDQAHGAAIEFFGNIDHGIARDNIIMYPWTCGIQVHSDETPNYSPSDIQISGGWVYGSRNSASGIAITGSSGLLTRDVDIQGVTTEHNGYSGIEIGWAENVTVRGVTSRFNPVAGVTLFEGASDVIVSDSRLTDNQYAMHSNAGEGSIGPAHFTTNDMRGSSTSAIVFAGAHPSPLIFRDNIGFINEARGYTSVADGGTISHGMASGPTTYQVTPSVAGEIASITSADASNITIAIKQHDGSAGTTQFVAWQTSYDP